MRPIFPRNIQCTVLRNYILVTRRVTCTGLSPSMAGRSRPLPLPLQGIGMCPYSTSTLPFGKVFGLSSSLFTRRYSGNPYWFLFLGVLGCFDSPGSHSQWECHPKVAGSPIRTSPVQRLHAPTRSVSPLGASFIGSRAKPSTSRFGDMVMSTHLTGKPILASMILKRISTLPQKLYSNPWVHYSKVRYHND